MSDLAERALHTRIGRSVEALRRSFLDNLFYVTGRTQADASPVELYTALAHVIRDRLLARFIASQQQYQAQAVRTVAFLSAEYLLGPQGGNNLLSLGLWDGMKEALDGLGLDLDTLLDVEEEPGLGNGGLGRLAACIMDSLATLQIPAIGYGLRYEYGIFDQTIRDGWQVEVADAWLRNGNPWELPRQLRYPVRFGGHTEQWQDDDGQLRVHWAGATTIYGVAYDTPILGSGVFNVNLLRLWKSEARESFDMQAFNTGDYYGAVNDMVIAQNLTKVLYPNDEPAAGKALRLRQQYFFVSCSLQDMIHQALQDVPPGDAPARLQRLHRFAERFVVHLNDTHPAMAIAECMRLLVDEHGLPWDTAWSITREAFAYTNHTLLPEALETWPVALLQQTLPRHLEIIYEINQRFLDEMRMRFLHDPARLARLSLIDEGTGGGERRVRMAHLACVGSRTINGVAPMHTDLLKHTVLRDFHDAWPEKFQNKTNGVTPRRFIALANPPLAALIDELIDGDWLQHLDRLAGLEAHADAPAFQARWRAIKRQAKQRLAAHIQHSQGLQLDPDSLFDVQAKRIHEYKRQHLGLLHVLHLYQQLKDAPHTEVAPRTFVFGGKAAPGYHLAKLIIKLIHAVAEVVNHDPQVNRVLQAVFVPDFNVKQAQRVLPAADLSEQISMAGKEASGTGNMKMMMNGAVTIGTLDGANVEILDAVGEANFFLFGHTEPQLGALRAAGYHPRARYEQDEALRNAVDLIGSGLFSHGDRALFAPLIDSLLNHDTFMVCADFQPYLAAQARVSEAWAQPARWARMSIMNVARSGRFSSDRTVAEYNADIWHVPPQPVRLA